MNSSLQTFFVVDISIIFIYLFLFFSVDQIFQWVWLTLTQITESSTISKQFAVEMRDIWKQLIFTKLLPIWMLVYILPNRLKKIRYGYSVCTNTQVQYKVLFLDFSSISKLKAVRVVWNEKWHSCYSMSYSTWL